jgi:hypothetical protein
VFFEVLKSPRRSQNQFGDAAAELRLSTNLMFPA